MKRPDRTRLAQLARLGAMLRDRALADHAAVDAARRELAARMAEERARRAKAAAAPVFGSEGAAPEGTAPPEQVEKYLDWSQARLLALGSDLAAAAARSEASRTRAARAMGRADVLDRLARDARSLRRPGARGR